MYKTKGGKEIRRVFEVVLAPHKSQQQVQSQRETSSTSKQQVSLYDVVISVQ